MVSNNEIQEIYKLIDNYSQMLVGILCKRIELIEKISKDNPTTELIKLYPKLFKSLSKEIIYENSRTLKNELRALCIPTIVYRGK